VGGEDAQAVVEDVPLEDAHGPSLRRRSGTVTPSSRASSPSRTLKRTASRCTNGKPSTGGDGIDASMAGEQTRNAIAAQPAWLAQVPTDRRFPAGARLLFSAARRGPQRRRPRARRRTGRATSARPPR